MTSSPSIRASLFHSNLEALEALGPHTEARVRAALPAGLLDEVEASSRVAWLPLELDIVLTETVGRVMGREKMRAWSRDGIVRATAGPLLSPIVRSAVAVFGLTPHSILRRMPQAWSMCFRECGQADYAEDGARRGTIRVTGAPASLTDHPLYLEGVSGALEGAILTGGAKGGDVHPESNSARGEVRFHCSW